MATATRYWRVLFRTTNNQDSDYNLGFERMQLYKADGTEVVPASVTTSAASENAVTYPLANILNSAPGTYWVVRLNKNANTLFYVQFDLGAGNETLIDRIYVQTKPGPWPRTTIQGAVFDFLVDNSDDGVTFYRQSLNYRPLAAGGGEGQVPANPLSEVYPLPSRDSIGGGGGIYGIVSEDGIALPNRPVILYERDTFAKVAWITTDENGGYGFNGLNTAKEFMVLSYDPSGPPFKNALVWDRIKPINALSNVAPQSAFWARRARESSLGGIISAADYLDGASFRQFKANIIGSQSNATVASGLDFLPASAVGGSVKFLKSGRTPTYAAYGFSAEPTLGVFSDVNAAGMPANYSALTFEYIFVAPTGGEPADLFFVWSGTRDSDDANMYTSVSGSRTSRGAGPTLEITRSGAVNVRFPLGGRNRSVVRCTTTVAPGTMHHVMVTYAQDSEIKLYLDGVLVQTTAIPGTGRLWGHTTASPSSGNDVTVAVDDFDGYSSSHLVQGAIRRLVRCLVAGNGNVAGTSNAHNGVDVLAGPGYGGAFGIVGLYGRVFSDADVATFYDSFVNWDTHTVPTTLPGYMGEVEADNPVFYARMNELALPTRMESVLGQRAHTGTYEATAGFGATGFVGGTTAINTATGGATLQGITLNTEFTIEFFMRPASVAGEQCLLINRRNNNTSLHIYLAMVGNKLELRVVDKSGTMSTIPFASPALLPGQDYHIVVTYDPWSTFKCVLYVNGVLASESAAPAIPYVLFEHLSIGYVALYSSGTGVSARFNGVMGELAIYNYALSAARIQAHYDARSS